MATIGSFRKVMRTGAFVLLFAIAALFGLVFWGGRGILESPRALDAEWLTVSAGQYELRGKVYMSKEALVADLRQLEPRPADVSVRWVAPAASAPASLAASAAEAQGALRMAGIQTPEAVVGNQIFWPAPAAPSGSR